MEWKQLEDLLNRFGIPLIIIFTGFKQMWVFGHHHRAMIALERQRAEEWKKEANRLQRMLEIEMSK